MVVLIVLFTSLFVLRVVGFAGVTTLDTWLASARGAIATMFLFTGASHFTPMKKDLMAMVPRLLPRPDLLVFLTGIAELAGAVGLLFPMTRLWAAYVLILLMVAMLPANISASRRGVLLGGRPATSLWLRVPMQVLFIAWTWIVRN